MYVAVCSQCADWFWVVAWRLLRNSFAVSCILSREVRATSCRLSLAACTLDTMSSTLCNTRVVSCFNIILLLEVAYFEVSWAPGHATCIFKQWSLCEPRHFWYRVSISFTVCCEYSFGEYLAKECLVLCPHTVSLVCSLSIPHQQMHQLHRVAHEKPARRLVEQRGRRSGTLYRKLNNEIAEYLLVREGAENR